MAYTGTNATAWGEGEVLIGAVNGTDPTKMPASGLTSIGILKEGSISFEQQEGTTKEWKAVGGTVVDTITTASTLKIKFHVKNLNKGALEKIFGVKDDGEKLAVTSLVSSTEYALQFASKVKGAEVFEAPRVKLAGTIVYSEDAGYGVDIAATILSSGTGKPLFYISKAS